MMDNSTTLQMPNPMALLDTSSVGRAICVLIFGTVQMMAKHKKL